MDFEENFLKYLPQIRSNIIPLGIGFFGLALISIGILASLSSKPREEITFQPAEKSEQADSAKIFVDISGAVAKPGVYSLKEGGRVKDVLILAEGLSNDADRDWVSRNLNLAQKVSDGSKIYIPRQGETVTKTSTLGVVQSSSLININSASASELESLAGVGPVTANKIIENRPYGSVEELKTKKIVGQSVFEKIKDKISIY